MRRTYAGLTLVALLGLAAGCSQSNSEGQRSERPADPPPAAVRPAVAQQAPSSPANPQQLGDPDQVVAHFLEALRDGNDDVAAGLLTDKAREETAKNNLAVHPPGAPSATFEIGKVEYLSSQRSGAHVSSIWSERDPETGETVSYEIIWALRRQPDGWHIAGMATQIAEDEPPVFLNFEDPAEMLRTWHDAEDRIARENYGAQENKLR